ncbi:hypothetical protein ACFL1H_06305 [Nanoarchaeota archaeon]
MAVNPVDEIKKFIDNVQTELKDLKVKSAKLKSGSKLNDSGRSVSVEEFNKLQQWYSDELKRKDKIIDELQEKNDVLLKSMIRQADNDIEMKKLSGKVDKK